VFFKTLLCVVSFFQTFAVIQKSATTECVR